MHLLERRINRETYWSFVAVLMGIIVIALFTSRSISHLSVILAVPCILRMHDLGWSGWWITPIYALQLTVGLAGLLLAKEEQTAYLMISGILAACVALLGSLPGDKHSNRFGVRPPRGVNLGWAARES